MSAVLILFEAIKAIEADGRWRGRAGEGHGNLHILGK